MTAQDLASLRQRCLGDRNLVPLWRVMCQAARKLYHEHVGRGIVISLGGTVSSLKPNDFEVARDRLGSQCWVDLSEVGLIEVYNLCRQ